MTGESGPQLFSSSNQHANSTPILGALCANYFSTCVHCTDIDFTRLL